MLGSEVCVLGCSTKTSESDDDGFPAREGEVFACIILGMNN